jgi:1-deoxy-D-xylulose-5-phosphate reductoisomerase
MSVRRLVVLGSTGSIGRQALEVASTHPDRVGIVGLAAGSALDVLCAQAREFLPRAIALERAADPEAARDRLEAAAPGARVDVGPGSAARLVETTACNTVLNGIVGAAGLEASLATLTLGRRLALANKETLVVGGPLVAAALARHPEAELIPVDSEHSAAMQCLAGRPAAEVARLTITASGGALRDHPDWRRATRDEVLAHPVWAMGPRITVDSATLFNKGLELIEAHWLFGLDWGQLDAVLHPQARFHALVTFVDGSIIAQAAAADMRLPIRLGISWPEHWSGPPAPLAAPDLSDLSFAAIPAGRHPAYDLARAAGRAGGTAPCALNAADEVAVEAFLSGKIALGAVPDVIAAVMDAHRVEPVESLAQLREVDVWARDEARAGAARR